MEIFIQPFKVLLYQPLYNALVLLYLYFPGHDFGIAVILLTVITRLIMYPLMLKSIKTQKALAELQPKIQEIQQKFKDDKARQTKETVALYQQAKINPFGGCLPLLLQLPMLFALYQVFWKGFGQERMYHLYSFIPRPDIINPFFLGLVDLSKASPVIAILAGISQYFQTKMMTPATSLPAGRQGQTGQFSNMLQKQMLYFFPVFTVFIVWGLPSAIGLYWTVTNIFSIVQQYLVFKGEKSHGETKF